MSVFVRKRLKNSNNKIVLHHLGSFQNTFLFTIKTFRLLHEQFFFAGAEELVCLCLEHAHECCLVS